MLNQQGNIKIMLLTDAICKFIHYNLIVFQTIHDILLFDCAEAPLKYPLDCIFYTTIPLDIELKMSGFKTYVRSI